MKDTGNQTNKNIEREKKSFIIIKEQKKRDVEII